MCPIFVSYYYIDCGFLEKEEEELKKHIEDDHAYIYTCIYAYMQVSYILVIGMIIMKKHYKAFIYIYSLIMKECFLQSDSNVLIVVIIQEK